MALLIGDNFSYQGRKPNFTRDQFQTLEQMRNFPDTSIDDGHICYCVETNKHYKFNTNNSYSVNTGKWRIFASGTSGSSDLGYDILDQDIINNIDPSELPEKYIIIPNKESDLAQNNISREIQMDGTYVDILFSALRKLQSEVARLKNSFKYGIYSYTGATTAMSSAVQGIVDPDDEPLWAIDPEDLSQIFDLTIGIGTELEPSENVNVGTEGILRITGDAVWTDDGTIREAEDVKLITFITSSSLDINLRCVSDGEINIDLSSFDISKVDYYNIMIVINRKVDNNSKNYIYISVSNAQRSQVLAEGYLNEQYQLQSQMVELEGAYYFNQVTFSDLDLTKFTIYSKYQDFQNEVIPSTPTDEYYKYKVAHITIRSVSTEQQLKSIQNQLPNNELIFVENTRKLWIKNNDQLINIGSSGGSDPGTGDDMTETEIINLLKEMGIVKEDGQHLQISDLSDLTFIHQDTGRRFKFSVNGDGELVSQQLPEEEDLLSSRVETSGVDLKSNVRGFIGQLRMAESSKAGNAIAITSDARIFSDRVKVGAFYAPLSTDTVHGCTKAFVELENTADCDFSLQGCYLHFTCPNDMNEQVVYHLALTGTIPAGGTYLITGKRYAQDNDTNSYIKVGDPDQEWYINGELADFSINSSSDKGYGFALTYGNAELKATDYLQKESDSGTLSSLGISSASKFPYIVDPSLIDAIYFYKSVLDSSSKGYWADMALAIKSNTMYKNMFELDPAKQAFQAYNTADSSRTRWQSTNDVWIVDLSLPQISFPHSEQTYSISNFTPKASFEHKNVSTDKSKLDMNKPNMVNCSFGLDMYRDRCFNWISAGVYDEYVWLKKESSDSWEYKFESYTTVGTANEKPESFPARKEYSKELNNAAYARMINRFPADNTLYTSHKCVVRLKDDSTTVDDKEKWIYVVGRADINGNPDPDHISEEMSFTLYSDTYTPVIYQITDQQGFHWVEYQVWAAAANKLIEKIKADQSSNIIPVIINTGDMTQNGTRINEWLDYYNACFPLLKEYEHNAVVGNNDLCNTDVTALGTGDDQGKSNSFYFHVFFCYDIDESVFVPIVNNKYIPSLYYFDSKDFRFVMANSEITVVNCQQWFNLIDNEATINIYTGWTVEPESRYINTFTSIYTMMYNILTTEKQCVVSCHEMPFTVITNESIASDQQGVSRSISKANALVGSHMNQISNADTGKGTYWFSRLLEQKGVKLVLGGHKHTYACTYPLREYFLFGENKNSKDNFEEYSMENTLQNDNVTWVSEGKNLTKFPLTKREDAGSASTGFYPYTSVPELTGGVTYFMCQATGYKLTSNKELPSANQKFSLAVPQTSNTGGSDKANDNQKYPMFAIIKLTTGQYDVKLVRIANIFDSGFKFSQTNYSTEDMKLQYFTQVAENNYGKWGDTEETMLTL